MTRATIKKRPEDTPYPDRPWEARCLNEQCIGTPYARTWHSTWHNAMGRIEFHQYHTHTVYVPIGNKAEMLAWAPAWTKVGV